MAGLFSLAPVPWRNGEISDEEEKAHESQVPKRRPVREKRVPQDGRKPMSSVHVGANDAMVAGGHTVGEAMSSVEVGRLSLSSLEFSECVCVQAASLPVPEFVATVETQLLS